MQMDWRELVSNLETILILTDLTLLNIGSTSMDGRSFLGYQEDSTVAIPGNYLHGSA